MSDLEWLATHLGWNGLRSELGQLVGIPPESTRLDWSEPVPRYDQSIDLMVELVETKLKAPLQQAAYLEQIARRYEGLYNTDRILQAELKGHNAPASLRLKAYRKVMGHE